MSTEQEREVKVTVTHTLSIKTEQLPLTMDLVSAGKILGVGRSTAYELVRQGTFPVRVLKLGNKFRVSRADLLAYLGESA